LTQSSIEFQNACRKGGYLPASTRLASSSYIYTHQMAHGCTRYVSAVKLFAI